MSDLEDLDSLYKDARRAYIGQQKVKAAKSPPPTPIDPGEKYRNPANWTRTRGVAVIHAETQTLLGSFDEFVHRSDPGCRKLVRSAGLVGLGAEATETVSGSWWLAPEHKPEPRQEWHTRRSAVLHLHLDRLHIHSPLCEVVVHLSYGSIARVELALETTFAQEDRAQEQLVFLPAGTDVLKEMSLDSKIALRVELGAQT